MSKRHQLQTSPSGILYPVSITMSLTDYEVYQNQQARRRLEYMAPTQSCCLSMRPCPNATLSRVHSPHQTGRGPKGPASHASSTCALCFRTCKSYATQTPPDAYSADAPPEPTNFATCPLSLAHYQVQSRPRLFKQQQTHILQT